MVRYVYYIFDHNTAEFYIGSRTYHGKDIKKDPYMGSSCYWGDCLPDNVEKHIVQRGFKTEESKYQYEYELINKHFDNPKNVNLHNPADGWHYDRTGIPLTAETKKKMSEAKKGENHPMYGKHHTAEAKRKMSQTHKGKYKGENHPMYGVRGKNSPQAKAVLHLVTGKIYDTARQAEKETGENHRTISTHCQGINCKNNPRWKFADEVTNEKGYWIEQGVKHIKSGEKFSTFEEASKAFNCSRRKVGNHCHNKVQNPEFRFYKEKIMWEK